MLTPDEYRFETFLKEFRLPLPEPLALTGYAIERRGSTAGRAWAMAVLGIALVGGITLCVQSVRRVGLTRGSPVVAPERVSEEPPLILRNANELLFTAPSFQTAVETLVLRSQLGRAPKGKGSAMAVLGEVKIKL